MSHVFYMSEPDLFGVWKGEATPEFTEGASVFKFTQATSYGTLAEFSICEESSAQRTALVGLRRWMSSVCSFEGFAPANTRVISTVKPGIAEKQADGSWKVKEQVVVDFVV